MAAATWCSKFHAVQIVAFLILWAETGQVFGQEIGRKFFKTKIVYDVSQVIRSNEPTNQSEILPEHLYLGQVNTSANYYFKATDSAQDHYCSMYWKCSSVGIKGISLIFSEKANKSDVLALADVTITLTIIKNLLKRDKSSIDSVTFLLDDIRNCEVGIAEVDRYLVDWLAISSSKQSIEVGIEYNDEFLKRCAGVSRLDYLDHTILTIPVSPMTTMLSYGVFSRRLNELIGENRELVRKLCPHCSLYIRLDNVHWNTTISAENYERYNALMTTYLDTFSKQNGGKEIFIVSPILKRSKIVPDNVYLRQNISLLYSDIEGENFANVSSKDRNHLACAHQSMVKLLLANIQNILVSDSYVEVLSSLSTICKTTTEHAQTHFIQPPDTFISLWLTSEDGKLKIDKQVEKIPEILRSNPAGIKIERVYLPADDFNETDSLTKAVNLLQSQNIDTGCSGSDYHQHIDIETNVSAIFDGAFKKCGALMNLSKEILVLVEFETKQPEDVLKIFIRLDQAKRQSERVYPGKKLILYISLSNGPTYESFYCSSKAKQFKEYYQTAQSFANIQGWSKFLLKVDTNNVGLWKRVPTDKQIDIFAREKFPVLFRTNAPPTAADKELAMTYPCLHRTSDARQSNINFLENKYSGASFQTNLREGPPLSTAELQTLLELALKRFTSVEINAASQTDFKFVEKVVAANAIRHGNNDSSSPSVYIEVPLAAANDLWQDIETFLSHTPAAVHVSNWESLLDKQQSLRKGVQYNSSSNFEVTVQNCSHEVNSEVATLRNLPFVPQVSYIVCNTPTVVPNNRDLDWMKEYLGTLFYTKSFMEHFLSIGRETGNGVEVMFRLNYICLKANEMEIFLRFLNDVNQHSAAYKIRYFLVRAFEGEASANCVNSWWRPDSYAELSNISTFVNREDEYARREARIFPAPPSAPVPDQNSNAIYFILVPILTLVIVGVLALLLYQRKQKTRILTQSEICQFYNGGEQSNPSSANSFYGDFGNMKFPKRYEIPLRDIETEEIIGSGQFGVVHRGILSKSTEVAVKIPRTDCGKEQFKSTLMELKILCHIGEHLNIVSFLGACTKSIANGRLYILIEYCKNGCLLKYLRQNQENSEKDSSMSLFELCGFALGIASGMEYIAKKRVVHGDLAARNVLLTSELTCKIADFGLSRRLYEMNGYEYLKTTQEPLPWRWMAPESLRNMIFTTKSDVWSYGVTLWEIFSLGMVPYPGLIWTVNFVAELESGMRMSKALKATDDIHAKTLECWNRNTDERPTFTELKEYFVGLRNEQYLKLDKA